MIRMLGVGLLLTAGLLGGSVKASAFRRRLETIRHVQRYFITLRQRLLYSMQTSGDLMCSVYEQLTGCEPPENWQEALCGSLDREDRDTVCAAFRLIGRSDVQTQVCQLNETLEELRSREQELIDEERRCRSVSLTVGAMTGLAVAVCLL